MNIVDEFRTMTKKQLAFVFIAFVYTVSLISYCSIQENRFEEMGGFNMQVTGVVVREFRIRNKYYVEYQFQYRNNIWTENYRVSNTKAANYVYNIGDSVIIEINKGYPEPSSGFARLLRPKTD